MGELSPDLINTIDQVCKTQGWVIGKLSKDDVAEALLKTRRDKDSRSSILDRVKSDPNPLTIIEAYGELSRLKDEISILSSQTRLATFRLSENDYLASKNSLN